MKSSKIYCGPLSLGGVNFHKEFDVLRNISSSRKYYFTYKGRCGLGLLCQHWKLKSGDEVLMPAYNCGTEVDPFVYYGLDVTFYRVGRNAKIDISDLLSRVSGRTRVIYVIHYFGWPQNIRELSKYCADNNIYLIEDCALALYSNPSEHPIGVLGDASIYSLPKTLPVPDGGLLTIRTEASNEPPAARPHASEILQDMLPLIKRSALRLCDRVGVFKYLPRRLIKSRRSGKPPITPAGLPEMPESYYYDKSIEKMSASCITCYIVKHTSPEFVAEQRRANYIMLYEGVKDLPFLQPLYKDLPMGVCPLYMPVIVKDRETVCNALNRKGIAAIQWWAGFHRSFDWTGFPDARYLKEHVLALPIHQQLTSQHISYIADQLLQIPRTL